MRVRRARRRPRRRHADRLPRQRCGNGYSASDGERTLAAAVSAAVRVAAVHLRARESAASVQQCRGTLVRQAPPPSSPLDETNWSRHEAYLTGVDLFNHGYYWEAATSRGVGVARRRSPRPRLADLLKGLIHLAAAGVKSAKSEQRASSRTCTRPRACSVKVAETDLHDALGLTLDELPCE